MADSMVTKYIESFSLAVEEHVCRLLVVGMSYVSARRTQSNHSKSGRCTASAICERHFGRSVDAVEMEKECGGRELGGRLAAGSN